MGAITKETADKIMSKIGYTRYSDLNPNNSVSHECWYGILDVEQFGVCIRIRLYDAAFKFQYRQNSPGTMSVLQTDWFSPVTSRKHFMRWFNSFVEDARWLSKKYAEAVDPRILRDMVILCDGVMDEFTLDGWDAMSLCDKLLWCEDYGLEHTHVIVD